jgi:hypothetical protein
MVMLREPQSIRKGSSVTQSDVSTSAGGSENTRSALATGGRNATDLDRPGRGFAGSAVELAELEEVDIRTVFQRDGGGFSDWLSANLDRLAKELGVSGLREVGRDVGVGSFTVDILAQTDRGRRVAIMNQLEPSDHPHLGQMVTFAAGLDVSAIIWITTRVGEEHRAVLDWLNQHGDDDVRFFGVELRLLRIGNSTPAASFHVESRPNDWQKVVKQRQRVGSPLNSRMREFCDRVGAGGRPRAGMSRPAAVMRSGAGLQLVAARPAAHPRDDDRLLVLVVLTVEVDQRGTGVDEAVIAVELGLLLRPQPIARPHAGRALYERPVVQHPDLVAVLDRVAQRDEAHARADVGRVEQPPSWLVDLCVVIDVDDRTDLGSAAIQYDAALPPSRDVECRHRVPPFHCFAAGRRRQVAIAARMLPGRS